MLEIKDFPKHIGQVTDWIKEYYSTIRERKVKSEAGPGDIYNLIPPGIPQESVDFDQILEQFKSIVVPGMTHWQHPNFHAYFPANGSIESLFAEFITATLGAQCMIWDTSPAAAELEERMMEWLRDILGIPKSWTGVIQDTASSATLVALITARERATNFESNENGTPQNLRVYSSSQTHSSIEKAMGVAGMGRKNLVSIGVDDQQAMIPSELESAIISDLEGGKKPCAVVVTIGTTSTLAVDPLEQIARICEKYKVWCHVDAAYAGSALILPEYGQWMKGIEVADSFVFNPHKWLFTHFDCSVYFIKNQEELVRCFSILPAYLKTNVLGQVNDYRDWGIPLGRRFRALKLWFVLQSYGLQGLQETLRKHIQLADYLYQKLKDLPNLKMICPPRLNGVFFHYNHDEGKEMSNKITSEIHQKINATNQVYLTHTVVNDIGVIRVICGQTYLEKADIDKTIDIISRNWNHTHETIRTDVN